MLSDAHLTRYRQYCSKTYNPWASPFSSHQRASTKEIISDIEVRETASAMTNLGVWREHSGAVDATLFYSDIQEDMFDYYERAFPSIQSAVERHGGRIRGRGGRRSKKTLLYVIMKRLRLLRKKQAHACPICTKGQRDKKILKQLRARRATTGADGADLEELDEEIAKYEAWVAYAEAHDVRRLHQRKATTTKWDSLLGGGREMLVFIDYVSFYLASGEKKNTHVFSVEVRDGDEPDSPVKRRFNQHSLGPSLVRVTRVV